MTEAVLDMHNIKGTRVTLARGDKANTTHVTTVCDHDLNANLKLKVAIDGALLEVNLHGVTDLDGGVGVAEGAAIMCDNIGDALVANSLLHNLAELELGLILLDGVHNVAALDIKEQTVVLVDLGHGDDI